MFMQRWKQIAVIGALAFMALCATKAHASQSVRRIVLKYHSTVAANTIDSTAAFSVAGASRVRLHVWSTDVDSTIAATAWPASVPGTGGSGLGLALADSTLGAGRPFVRCITNTSVYGVRSETSLNTSVIRLAPAFGATNIGAVFEFVPITTAGANSTGSRSVFYNLAAKWYLSLTGTSSRATDYNVVAYVYYDNQ